MNDPTDSYELGLGHDALTYAAGWLWPTFPVAAGGKSPAARRCPDAVDNNGRRLRGDDLEAHARGCLNDGHGLYDGTTNVDRIIGWWERSPTANVGIRTGRPTGLVVVDVDRGGTAAMRALLTELGELPRTHAVRTPSGGLHAYFAYPWSAGDVRIGNSASKLGSHVDIRGDGGYVVAPPSKVDGKRYRWMRDPYPGPPDLPDLPDAWAERLVAPPRRPPRDGFAVPLEPAAVSGRTAGYVNAAVLGEVEAVATAVMSTRNDTLFRAAMRFGSLEAAGALDGEAGALVLIAAAQRAGLSAHEAETTVDSGMGYGADHPAELPEGNA